jgi:hypothetical protein
MSSIPEALRNDGGDYHPIADASNACISFGCHALVMKLFD